MPFEAIFDFLSNNTLSRAELSTEGKIMNIHYGDVLIKYESTLDAQNTKIPFISTTSQEHWKNDFLCDGDIIIADTAEDETVGKVTEIYNIMDSKIVSGLHTIPCRAKVHFSLCYLGFYMNSEAYHRQLYSLMQGIKVFSISKANISKTRIRFPSIPNQEKIVSLLIRIDKKIQLQQELIVALKSYKRGVLSAIFNGKKSFKDKNGLPYPKWEKTKIGTIFSERCERANGDQNLLAVTINSGIVRRDEIELKDNSSEDKSNYKCVHIDDIAYNTMRMWQGASGVSSYTGIVSPAYTVIFLNTPEDNDIRFWGYYFKTYKLICEFQRYSQGLTSDTWNLKYEQLANIPAYLPTAAEQTLIADYIDKIQHKIQQEKYHLEKIITLKRGILSKIFI